MSVVEDSRKLLQDFVAPELRAIDARLSALEKRFDEAQSRTDRQFAAVDKRFDTMEARLDKRFDSIDRRLDYVLSKLDYMTDVQDMKQRLARLEAQSKLSAGSASEAA